MSDVRRSSIDDVSMLETGSHLDVDAQIQAGGTTSRHSEAISDEMDTGDSKILLAIYQNERNYFEMAVSAFDFNFSVLTLDQFVDNRNLGVLANKIEIFNPYQVLIPTGLLPCINPLNEFIEKQLKDKCISYKSQFFTSHRGLSAIEKYCSVDCRGWSELTRKNLAMNSAGALFKHIEGLANIQLAPKSVRLRLENDENTTLIDSATSKSLELISNARNPKSSNNLFGVVCSTKTKNGRKSLRANILQPPSNVDVIENRLQVVDDLSKDLQLCANLRYMMKRFIDLEAIVKFCYQAPKLTFECVKKTDTKIIYILGMRMLLEEVATLMNLVKDSSSDAIKGLFNSLIEQREFEKIREEIDAVIEPNVLERINESVFKANKCFALKKNIDGYLDVSREAYVQIIDHIKNYVAGLCEQTELPIKFNFNQSRGYYLTMSMKNDDKKSKRSDGSSIFSTKSARFLESLPSEFIKISKNANSVHFTTKMLMKLNERVYCSISDIYHLTDTIINGLLSRMRPNFDCFFKISEILSDLDVNLSFVNYSQNFGGCTRPKFGRDLILANSYHPVLLGIKQNVPSSRNQTMIVATDRMIGNSIRVSSRTPFVILTGSNMSGKSTFLKQLGNLQVLAQCGSFVPAELAQFPAKKRIFALTGDYSNEADSNKHSSFERELIEINYILQNWTDNTLILIDELCRNTNYYEGLALAMAICELILKRLSSNHESNNITVVFATHHKELTYLQNFYPMVKCVYFESCYDSGQKKINHTYQLKNGVNKVENYGFELMAMNPLPSSIIQDAQLLTKKFKENFEELFSSSRDDRKRRLVMDLFNEFSDIAATLDASDDLTDEQLAKIETLVEKFENEFARLINN